MQPTALRYYPQAACCLAQSLLTLHTLSKEGESKGKPQFYLQTQKYQNSPRPFLRAFFLKKKKKTTTKKTHHQPTLKTSSSAAGRGFLACCQGTSPGHHLLRKGLSLQNGAWPPQHQEATTAPSRPMLSLDAMYRTIVIQSSPRGKKKHSCSQP